MTTNICVEYIILFGPCKGERTHTWFAAEDPEIKRILNDSRMNGKIIERV